MAEQKATRTVRVPAQSGRAAKVGAGSLVAIVDLEGQQIGDFFAYSADDPTEFLSAGHTRATNRRFMVRPGETFYTNHRRPILTMIEDTSPGYHDMLFPPCDIWRYRSKGIEGWHANCEENFRNAVGELGHEFGVVPMPFNVFQNSPVVEDGRIDVRDAASKPGDRVVFRTEMDVVVVLTSCAVDDVEANGPGLSDLQLEIIDASTGSE
jgi:hypothetical protein